MTRSDLQAATRKKLAQLARRHRISGWHSMRKQELVDALARVAAANGRRGSRTVVPRRPERCRLNPTRNCDRRAHVRDQLIVEDVDDRWLRARWILSERILNRARVALGAEWPQAVPVLRVYDVTERNGNAGERVFVKDEEIRVPIDDWFIPVEDAALSYRVELGYRTPQGAFFLLARSARVRPPQLGGTTDNRNGLVKSNGDPTFEIHADVVLFGQAHPCAGVSLMGKPVQPHADGSFSVRLSLEDGRQVIPAVCVSPNGCTQRTIVLAIERNTKHLEPTPVDEMA